MLELVGVLGALAAALGYLGAVHRSRRRGWPGRRTALWLAGLLAAVLATAGPLAEAAHHDFRAHVLTHLLVAMVAPLLLVLGAPVTLALRVLPLRSARRLARVLGRWPVRVLTEPLVAAALNLGGLWVLYRTPLLAATQDSALLHVLVHGHMFAAGVLFTVALVGVDPMPHRRGFGHRAAVLVLVAAAHAVLAKSLYAAPPVGVTGEAVQTGAIIMYYGADLVEVAMMVVLCAGEYRRRARLSYPARTLSTSRSPGLRHGRSAP